MTHDHPSSFDERMAEDGPVLVDGCPRCDEHAVKPLETLDDTHLRALWERMLQVEGRLGRQERVNHASGNDADACRTLWTVWLFLERYPDLALEKISDVVSKTTAAKRDAIMRNLRP